jgi:hypothetical protein
MLFIKVLLMAYMKNYRLILLIAIFLLLFLAPLRWFSDEAFDACGDDPKMQFFAPEKYVENYSIYTWSSYNALSVSNLPHPNLKFSYLALGVSKLGLNPAQSQKFFYGCILAFGFLFVYLITKTIIFQFTTDKEIYFWPALFAGIIYVFSPLVQASDWISRLSGTIFIIFLFPAILYFFIKSVFKGKLIYLIPGALLSSIFAFAIYVPVPWTFSFFLGTAVFLVSYLLIFKKERLLALKTFILYLLLMSLVNLQSIIIMADSLLNNNIPMLPTGSLSSDMIRQSQQFIENIASNFNGLYSFFMMPSLDFMSLSSVFKSFSLMKVNALFIVFPLIIFMAFIWSNRREKKYLIAFAIPFLMLFYFITVSISDLGAWLFAWIVSHVPGFIMFRNFYGKFPITFSFFYSVLLGCSLAVIFMKLKSTRVKKAIVLCLFAIFVIYAWPLASGGIIGVSPSASIHERLCPEIPKSHLNAVDKLKSQNNLRRVSIFPVSFAQYMCFEGDNNQFYVAVPFVKILSSHDEMGGIWSYVTLTYPQMPAILTDILNNYDIEAYSKLLWFFNIGYLYVYENMAPENAQMFIFKYPYNPRLKKALLNSLKLEQIGNYQGVSLYKIDYFKQPKHIQASNTVSLVDRVEWFSKLIYSDFTSNNKNPQIIFKKD